MSGVFNSRFNHLEATLSSPVPLSKFRLVTAWVKWEGTQEPGRIPVQLTGTDGYTVLELIANTGMNAVVGLGSGGPGFNANNTPLVTGTWTRVSVSMESGTSGTVGYGSDINGTGSGNGYPISGTPTNPFNFLRIAQGGNINEFSNWNGRIAHVAVWSLDTQLEVDDVNTQTLTLAPTDVVGFTPVWYASLDTDATATGGAITTNGSPTYDGADNPTLSGGGDTTAPILTSAVGTQTGSTTATVGATTDEANGTLRVVVTTSATQPSIAQIKAGQDHTGATAPYAGSQTITTTGAKTFSATGLTASTAYYAHNLHTDAAANDSNRLSSSSFTTDTPDTTAPTLSSPTASALSNALIAAGVTTNEANGTLYVVATTSASPPSATQIRAGQNDGSTPAVFSANQVISSTGVKTFNVTGLTQLTLYYLYFHHQDAAGNNSTVSSANDTTFRDGATGQFIIDNTGPVGANPAGILYNDVVLPGDADKWFSFLITTPPADAGSLTIDPQGRFTWVGLSADEFYYQLEVDGVNVGSPVLVSLDPAGPPDEVLPELTGDITVTNLTTTSYDLSWPTGTDDTGVTGYEYSLNGGADWTSNSTATTKSVTGRTPGATDQVRVRCFDGAGNRSTPALAEDVTLLTPPPDPTPSNATKRTPNGMIGFWNR